MQFDQLKRREFITFLGSAATWPLVARAQQPAMPVIGLLGSETPELFASRWRAFGEGLSGIGYTEDRNYTVEYRWAYGRAEQLPELAAGLVRRRGIRHRDPGGKPPPSPQGVQHPRFQSSSG